jgi:hypothetical protein
MCNLVRQDMSQQCRQIYMKPLVQFFSRFEEHIAIAPTPVFAQVGDPKNGVGQIPGPARDHQLQMLWKLRGMAGRRVMRSIAGRLTIYPVHAHACLLEYRARRPLGLKESFLGHAGMVMDSDGHKNFRWPLVLGPYRRPA